MILFDSAKAEPNSFAFPFVRPSSLFGPIFRDGPIAGRLQWTASAVPAWQDGAWAPGAHRATTQGRVGVHGWAVKTGGELPRPRYISQE